MTETKDWKQEVGDWKASGLTADAFSKQRGYPRTRLWAWSSRLKKSEAAAGERPRLMRVIRAKPAESGASVVLELHGARVLVMPGADGATLSRVLQAVRSVHLPGAAR